MLKKLGFTNAVRYVGRRAIATTAVGSSELHKKEVEELNAWIKKLIAV